MAPLSPGSSSPKTIRDWLFWAAIVAVAVAIIAAFPPSRARFDFAAFYCAGNVMAAGEDPYRIEPLRTCEASHLPVLLRNAAIPVPLPPFAIAGLGMLARLNFSTANAVWVLLLTLAAVAFVVSIVALTKLPAWLVALCTVSAVWSAAYQIGAMAPIPIALLTAGAVFVARRRPWAAAGAIGAACIQPHLGIPVMASVFILVPFMRLPCALAVGVLAFLSLHAGAALNVSYVASVLPAHAASELGNADQYALSTILHFAGLPDAVAITTGSIQYAVFVVAAIAFAGLLRYRMPEATVLVPVTFAVTGGTFIHQPEVAAALALALVLAARLKSAIAWTGVVLLAVPWQIELDFGFGFLAGLIVAGVLLQIRGASVPKAVSAGCAVILAFVLVRAVYHRAFPTGRIVDAGGGALAESAWRQVSALNVPTWSWIPAHMLTYAGVAIVIALTIRAALRRTPDERSQLPAI